MAVGDVQSRSAAALDEPNQFRQTQANRCPARRARSVRAGAVLRAGLSPPRAAPLRMGPAAQAPARCQARGAERRSPHGVEGRLPARTRLPPSARWPIAAGSAAPAPAGRRRTAALSKGWTSCTSWPTEQKYIFSEELEMAGAVSPVPMGVIYVGPVICAFGTPEQQARWLPGIQQSTTFWAQGYSEPESGSDLASLQCAARPGGRRLRRQRGRRSGRARRSTRTGSSCSCARVVRSANSRASPSCVRRWTRPASKSIRSSPSTASTI